MREGLRPKLPASVSLRPNGSPGNGSASITLLRHLCAAPFPAGQLRRQTQGRRWVLREALVVIVVICPRSCLGWQHAANANLCRVAQVYSEEGEDEDWEDDDDAHDDFLDDAQFGAAAEAEGEWVPQAEPGNGSDSDDDDDDEEAAKGAMGKVRLSPRATQRMEKLRIVGLATENGQRTRDTPPRYGLQSWLGESAGVAKRPRERSPTRNPFTLRFATFASLCTSARLDCREKRWEVVERHWRAR